MLENGYVTLPRLFFRNWEWSDDANTVAVFVRLLIEADIVPNSWHGIPVPRGGMVSSYTRLAEKTGLSVKKVRTAIKHLEAAGCVAKTAYPNCTVFAIKNFDLFQAGASLRSNEGQTMDKPTASNGQQNKKIKEDKEDKDDNTSDKEDKEDKEDKDDTVTGPTQKPETPDNDNKEDNKEEDNKEEDKEDSSNSTYKNGYYQVKNIVILDNEVGYSMVRGLLNETSNLEIRDGKYYLTFEMGQSSLMKDIVIKANSKELKYTKKNVGNDTIRITVEIPSLSSKLNISTYVTMMGKNVDFDLKLNQSTLKFVSSNEEGQLPGNNNNAGNNNGSNDSNNDSNTGNDNNAGGNITETVKGKLYTIKNEVIHENQTGKEMARKYLNSTSKIEEINGELYLTLTFTGTDLMNNHKFYVNGKSVSYTSSTSGNSKSYRFKINSLNDDIKVSAFIVPMSRNVEFGVKLLKDTYTFVKDFDASNDSNNAGNDSDNGNGGSNFDDMMNGGGNFEGFEDEKLPQTGSVINAESMLMGGSLITALGAFVGRRKRK